MKKKDNNKEQAAELRRKAEERLLKEAPRVPEDLAALTPKETRRALHDLRVHQIELEMQNEELRRAQTELTDARARYFDLYDQAPVGYVTVSEKGLVLEANLTALALLCEAQSALSGQPVSRFIFKEDQDSYYLFRKKLPADGAAHVLELRLKKEDGAVFWARLEGALARDGGAPVCRLVITDIDARKLWEESRETGRKILQILNEAGELKDSLRRILSVLKTYTGADAAGIRLRDGEDYPYFIQDGFSSEFLLAENALAARAADGGFCRDKNGEVSLECTCGMVITGHTDPANPLFTPGGSAWTNDSLQLLNLPAGQDPRLHPRNRCIHDGYASVALVPIRDGKRNIGLLQLNDRRKGFLTPALIERLEEVAGRIGAALLRKRAEEVLRRDGEALEELVRERSRELLAAQEAVLNSKRLSEIGILAATVAHELRNPLASIYLAASNIKRKADDPLLDRHLENIEKKVADSLQIINNLLVYSRIRQPQYKRLDIHKLLSECAEQAQGQHKDQISILKRFKALKNRLIDADPVQMRELFQNLLNNACEAMPERKGEIEIGTADDKNRVTVCIKDSGCGIKKDDLDSIFTPFFTTKNKGTGLGLSVCRQITNLHHGEIKAESKPGCGAVFTVSLPLKKTA